MESLRGRGLRGGQRRDGRSGARGDGEELGVRLGEEWQDGLCGGVSVLEEM